MKSIDNLETYLRGFHNIGFDLDHTLLDTSKFDYELFATIFAKYFDENKSKILSGKLIKFKKSKPYGFGSLFDDFFEQESISISINEFLDYYRYPPKFDLELDPRIKKMIQNLVDKNLFLITNGNSNVQLAKISGLGLAPFFNQLIVLDKHQPQFLKPNDGILKYIHLKEGKTVFIGDNDGTDRLFAKNCGFDYIDIKEYEIYK